MPVFPSSPVASIISTSIDRSLSRQEHPVNFPPSLKNYDTANAETAVDRSRARSPTSPFSVASAPALGNEENPSPNHIPTKAKIRSASNQGQVSLTRLANKDPRQARRRGRNLQSKPTRSTSSSSLSLHRTRPNLVTLADATSSWCEKVAVLDKRPPLTPSPIKPTSSPSPDACSIAAPNSGNTISTALTHHTALPSCVNELQQRKGETSGVCSDSSTRARTASHQQQLSDGSSGFVHTIKTASMSIVSCSLRLGYSHDNRSGLGSLVRCSLDSDRPMTSSTYDESLIRRGSKRFSIIDELITTEQTYVEDLKALAYLYSTLFASTSFSSVARHAIQRNLADLLRTHEKLLDRLQKTTLNAAARRWADTAVPLNLPHMKRSRLRASEKSLYHGLNRPHRCSGSSLDSSDGCLQAMPRTADPIDVADIAAEFKDIYSEFFAYEEYCANHSTISGELLRHCPYPWSAYEGGLEALTRAIAAIDIRATSEKKGLTVSDLLIKPIQRICKYPLLLEDLLTSTPVADSPGTHAELEIVLQCLKNVVGRVNLATDDKCVQTQIQKRWLLQTRLNIVPLGIRSDLFRTFGMIELCGVLHVTIQTPSTTEGTYALCTLFNDHFLIAMPAGAGLFNACIVIQLSDLKVEAATDGKVCFRDVHLESVIQIEEDQWVSGLCGRFSNKENKPLLHQPLPTICAVPLRSLDTTFTSQSSLYQESFMQRAAIVGSNRASISHVIVRNTHNASDLQEYRDSSSHSASIHRSQSYLSTKRIPVLEPKRSERVRMEQSIADVWTRDRLPFPGMIGSKGSQIIRASAGSLARKLSLASIHTPFSRARTSSLSTASRKSYDKFSDTKNTFRARTRSNDHFMSDRSKPTNIPEVDDMRSVVGRMIGGSFPLSKGNRPRDLMNQSNRNLRGRAMSIQKGAIEDPASLFQTGSDASDSSMIGFDTLQRTSEEWLSVGKIQQTGIAHRKKRWSNPIAKLKRGFQEGRAASQNKWREFAQSYVE